MMFSRSLEGNHILGSILAFWDFLRLQLCSMKILPASVLSLKDGKTIFCGQTIGIFDRNPAGFFENITQQNTYPPTKLAPKTEHGDRLKRKIASSKHGFSGAFFSLPKVTWVVISNIFYVHPHLGKIPILTNIFQMG